MRKLFLEFENENAQRTYPFASGCRTTDTEGAPIGVGVLIDAAIYPVNSRGTIYLSSISGGVVSISDDTGVIMTATHRHGADTLEFFETKGLGRHVGTILAASSDALDVLVEGSSERTFRPTATAFSSSCLFPIENDGVLSIDTQDTGAIDGQVEFLNSDSDDIRVSTDPDGRTLRFDALPHPTSELKSSIRHIYCIVDGKTPFRIIKMDSGVVGIPGNTIAVYLDNIDRSSVCGNAHREDALVMTDTCGCSPEDPDPVPVPDTYQTEVVDIPNGSDSSFYLAVPNFTGYDNPLSLTLDDGEIIPRDEVEVETDPSGRMAAKDSLADNTTVKSAILQVPGLGK